MSPDDCGGQISFAWADPVVPGALRLGGASALALVAKSVGVAALHRARGGLGQDISMDLRVAPHQLRPQHLGRCDRPRSGPARIVLSTAVPAGDPAGDADIYPSCR
jgi:hypothetical protein